MPTHARKLILCCDGTNNTLTGGAKDTNVLLLFEELRQREDGALLYYDPGVGSPDELPPTGLRQYLRRKWDRVAGLASGQGVFENIGEAYSFLVREYRAGDEIWLFGFSRGAFTARSVSGMVHLFGIVRPEHLVLLPTLLRVYFSRAAPRRIEASRCKHGEAPRDRSTVADQIRTTFTHAAGREAKVHFVGVWDTVESVGMPGMSLQISSTPSIRGKRIAHVRHALSLDEHRWPFLPRLYDEDDFGDPRSDPQSLRQAWFRGVHSDVGGGYARDQAGLANDALAWMVAEANHCGLGCPPVASWTRAAAEQSARHRHDELYDTPWWALVGMSLRATDRPRDHAGTVAPATCSVWESRRPLAPLGTAIALGALALAGSGFMLMPGESWPGILDPAQWLAAVGLAVEFAGAQALAFLDPDRAFDVASQPGSCPRRAMVFDLAFVACYAYVLARVCTRAFANLAGAREPGRAKPKWKALGGALPLLLAGDVVEDLLALLAVTLGRGSAGGQITMGLGSLGSAAKLVGATLCLALVTAALFVRDRRDLATSARREDRPRTA